LFLKKYEIAFRKICILNLGVIDMKKILILVFSLGLVLSVMSGCGRSAHVSKPAKDKATAVSKKPKKATQMVNTDPPKIVSNTPDPGEDYQGLFLKVSLVQKGLQTKDSKLIISESKDEVDAYVGVVKGVIGKGGTITPLNGYSFILDKKTQNIYNIDDKTGKEKQVNN
jgi:hypothetical protein